MVFFLAFFLLHTSEQLPISLSENGIENGGHGIPFWGFTIIYVASLKKFKLFVIFCYYKVTF